MLVTVIHLPGKRKPIAFLGRRTEPTRPTMRNRRTGGVVNDPRTIYVGHSRTYEVDARNAYWAERIALALFKQHDPHDQKPRV